MRLAAFGGIVSVLVARGALAQEHSGAVVHLDANDENAEVQVLRGGESDDPWTAACPLPCRRTLDPGDTYRIGGRGLRPTAPFTVPRDGHLYLTAEMRSANNRATGVPLTTFGALHLTTGIVLLVLGALSRPNESVPPGCEAGASDRPLVCPDPSLANAASTFFNTLAALFLVSGAALIVPGLVFLGRGTRSTVESTRNVASLPKLRAIPGGFAF